MASTARYPRVSAASSAAEMRSWVLLECLPGRVGKAGGMRAAFNVDRDESRVGGSRSTTSVSGAVRRSGWGHAKAHMAAESNLTLARFRFCSANYSAPMSRAAGWHGGKHSAHPRACGSGPPRSRPRGRVGAAPPQHSRSRRPARAQAAAPGRGVQDRESALHDGDGTRGGLFGHRAHLVVMVCDPGGMPRPARGAGRLTWQRQARLLKREVYVLLFAVRDPRVPWYAKALAGCVVAHALSPIDLIPDPIPVLGYLDDLVLIPLGVLTAVRRLIPDQVMTECQVSRRWRTSRPTGWAPL